ncbi:MAG: hypothetical protein LBT59_21920 [Clostridiales bacterium]|jgi:hypothetical protein|nr:hypothetical protein [Clostridiales bacterium]
MSNKKIFALIFMILELAMISAMMSACSAKVVADSMSYAQDESPASEGVEQVEEEPLGENETLISKQLEIDKRSLAQFSQTYPYSVCFSVMTSESKTVLGMVYMDAIADDLHLLFSSASKDDYMCKLKLLVDYVPTDFTIDGTVMDNYVFSVKSSDSFEIPFNLPDSLDFASPHILTAILIPNYDKHAVDGELVGVPLSTQDFMLIPPGQDAADIVADSKSEPPEKYLNITYQGVMFNTDFQPVKAKAVNFPPQFMEVSRGEIIKLAYRTGNYQDSEDVLILTLLNGDPIEIENKPYMLIQQKHGKISYGTFQIKAPEEPGEYEVVGIVTNRPFMQGNYIPFYDRAKPFTLVVK